MFENVIEIKIHEIKSNYFLYMKNTNYWYDVS